jgi:hypothetical protein
MVILDSVAESRLDKYTTTARNMILTRRRLWSLNNELLTVRPSLTGIAAAFACVVRHLNGNTRLVPECDIPLTLGIEGASMRR